MTSPGSPAAVIAYLATAIVELSGRGGRPSGVELLAILDSVAEDISKSRDSVARNLATTTADGTSKVVKAKSSHTASNCPPVAAPKVVNAPSSHTASNCLPVAAPKAVNTTSSQTASISPPVVAPQVVNATSSHTASNSRPTAQQSASVLSNQKSEGKPIPTGNLSSNNGRGSCLYASYIGIENDMAAPGLEMVDVCPCTLLGHACEHPEDCHLIPVCWKPQGCSCGLRHVTLTCKFLIDSVPCTYGKKCKYGHDAAETRRQKAEEHSEHHWQAKNVKPEQVNKQKRSHAYNNTSDGHEEMQGGPEKKQRTRYFR